MQRPGDELALAVRVGREIDRLARAAGAFEFRQQLFFLLDDDVFRLEVAPGIDAQPLARQIDDMPHRGAHLEIVAEKFLYCLCFGG